MHGRGNGRAGRARVCVRSCSPTMGADGHRGPSSQSEGDARNEGRSGLRARGRSSTATGRPIARSGADEAEAGAPPKPPETWTEEQTAGREAAAEGREEGCMGRPPGREARSCWTSSSLPTLRSFLLACFPSCLLACSLNLSLARSRSYPSVCMCVYVCSLSTIPTEFNTNNRLVHCNCTFGPFYC